MRWLVLALISPLFCVSVFVGFIAEIAIGGFIMGRELMNTVGEWLVEDEDTR